MSGEACAAAEETTQGSSTITRVQEEFNLHWQRAATTAAKEAWAETLQKGPAKAKAAAKAEAIQAKLDRSREEGPDPRVPRTRGQEPCGK